MSMTWLLHDIEKFCSKSERKYTFSQILSKQFKYLKCSRMLSWKVLRPIRGNMPHPNRVIVQILTIPRTHRSRGLMDGFDLPLHFGYDFVPASKGI